MLYWLSWAPAFEARAIMATILYNLQVVRSRISEAARAVGRDPAKICLVAVSKSWPTEVVRKAALAGQKKFGENYIQEAVEKITALSDLALEWHFIGPVQGNKTRLVAHYFSWVHSVDRLRIAQRLAEARGADRPPLQLCLQVNISGERSKAGVIPSEVAPLAVAVRRLPHVRLRGLMAIPEATDDVALLRRRYREVRYLKDSLAADGIELDTLSMGMSHDLETAVAAGATIVRVGTAIFGARGKADR